MASKATSVMPHDRNAIYYFNFLEKKNCTHAKPNWKTRTETIYRYTPNIYIFFFRYIFPIYSFN